MSTNIISKKIEDYNLLERVKGDSDEPVTVLVELDLPTGEVEFEEVDHFGKKMRLRRIASPAAADAEETSRKTEEARDFLERNSEAKPHWIQSAHAFVVQATGSQLSAIAEAPFTKAIYPNSRRR